MTVVAFNGSPRSGGNTEILLRNALEELEAEGIRTELIKVGGQILRGCTACNWCRESGEKRCVIDDDPLNGYLDKMREADGILLGSPTYFADLTAEMKALIDRSGYVLRPSRELKRKLGAGVVAARRGGALHTFDSLNHFFLINEMIVVGSSYWNDGIAGAAGAVAEDDEGINTARTLGRNMAWLLKKLES
ncbi:MAG: flavodoxin family protein [Pontiellaceae bacterium]|nr:flavodoxin family protein [Pontiellaceae bacterium]MBN2786416.1 flavodoxin family protein [Pontiellaceae bacterium]